MRRDDILSRFFDYGVDMRSRTLYMGDTDEEMVEYFLKGMAMLSHNSSEAIQIIMDNEGGDAYCGLAIYDAIATSKCHVTITVYGGAMSMGSWILQAADERVLTPHSTVMLHDAHWELEDRAKYVKSQVEEGNRLTLLMEQAYLKRIRQVKPRFTQARLRKMLDDETFLSAKEAVELGLADKVLEEI